VRTLSNASVQVVSVTGGMEFNSACETDRGSDMVEKVVKVEGVLRVWWRRVWFAWHVRSCPVV
jgi:hypothetical protein